MPLALVERITKEEPDCQERAEMPDYSLTHLVPDLLFCLVGWRVTV